MRFGAMILFLLNDRTKCLNRGVNYRSTEAKKSKPNNTFLLEWQETMPKAAPCCTDYFFSNDYTKWGWGWGVNV